MLDPGGGAAMAAGAAVGASIGASMMAFAQSAASGGFAISPTGGDAILKAIADIKSGIGDVRMNVSGTGLQLPLGGSSGAAVMSDVDAQVAQDGQGFLPMLAKFLDSLDAAEHGIKTAMENYMAMDERAAGRQQSA